MNMSNWRLIISKPDTGPNNMALDEALFTAHVEGESDCPSLRIYGWESPCITIGYFQEYSKFMDSGLSITRRLTGGLMVKHSNDVSYSFIASKKHWEHVYDQTKTYELIHSAIKQGLKFTGIETDFCVDYQTSSAKGNICTKTFYRHDLQSNNKKIAGSCQRRRGAYLLQQGSIHFDEKYDFDEVVSNLVKGFADVLKLRFHNSTPSNNEFSNSNILSNNKYSSNVWNKKY